MDAALWTAYTCRLHTNASRTAIGPDWQNRPRPSFAFSTYMAAKTGERSACEPFWSDGQGLGWNEHQGRPSPTYPFLFFNAPDHPILGFTTRDAGSTSGGLETRSHSALRRCLLREPFMRQYTLHGTNLLGIRRMSRATSGRMIYSDGILSSSINSRSFVPLMLSCSSESCGHTLAFVNVRQAWQ